MKDKIFGATAARIAGVADIVPISKYNALIAPQRAKFLTNLHSFGHVLTGEGWCYVFTTTR
jgi:hypothetical protein